MHTWIDWSTNRHTPSGNAKCWAAECLRNTRRSLHSIAENTCLRTSLLFRMLLRRKDQMALHTRSAHATSPIITTGSNMIPFVNEWFIIEPSRSAYDIWRRGKRLEETAILYYDGKSKMITLQSMVRNTITQMCVVWNLNCMCRQMIPSLQRRSRPKGNPWLNIGTKCRSRLLRKALTVMEKKSPVTEACINVGNAGR